MIDSRTAITGRLDKNDNLFRGLNSWSVFTCTEDQKTSHLAGDMGEVETWIQQLTTPENTITYHVLCSSPLNFAQALFSVSLGAILTPKRN